MRYKNDNIIKLKIISIWAWISRLINLPMQLYVANCISQIVSLAIVGDTNAVLLNGVILLAVVLVYRIFVVLTDIIYREKVSKSLHEYKISVYNSFLSNPLHVLRAMHHGDITEGFNDDFNTATGRYLSLYPTVYCEIISAVVYFVYLLYHSLLIAVSLLLVSVLQLIPPLIVKKRLQKNYDDCREIEAEITDFTVDGYDAFPTIKLYSLKEWWLSKLNKLHKKYIKIGKDEIYADQLNKVMENFLSTILKYGTYGLIGVYVLLGIAGKEIAIQSIALSSSFFTAILTAFSSIPDFAISKVADERMNSFLQTQMNESSSAVTVGNICLSEVSASLGKKRILQDASVCFSSELNIIKGANGVGKSTLLNLIVGLIKPDCGNISVGNTESEQLSDMVFPKKILYLPLIVWSFYMKKQRSRAESQ